MYSGCQKYESSPIIVMKITEFLSAQTWTYAYIQIRTLATETKKEHIIF